MPDDNPTFTPARSSTAKRQPVHAELAEGIRQMILTRELAPGERINELELSAEYGVSRTPLREVLKVLAAEGLIELIPNRGSWVAQITRADLIADFQVMAVLEGLAGELAATRVTDVELIRIRALQAEMADSFDRKDLPAYFRCNQEIHAAILDTAGNPALVNAHRMVSRRILSFRYRANLSRKRWSAALREHEVILGLLELGHARELGAVLRAHILKKLDVILVQFDELDQAVPSTKDTSQQGEL